MWLCCTTTGKSQWDNTIYTKTFIQDSSSATPLLLTACFKSHKDPIIRVYKSNGQIKGSRFLGIYNNAARLSLRNKRKQIWQHSPCVSGPPLPHQSRREPNAKWTHSATHASTCIHNFFFVVFFLYHPQGCQFDPTFLYLLLFFSLVLSLFLSYPFLLLAHSPDLFFPKPKFSER